jgi:hypothetical protein
MAYIEKNDPFLAGEDTTCFVCRKAADAYWHGGERNVCICAGCAAAVLPMLIADAVIARTPNAILDATVETIIKGFYRGAAQALQRLHRPRQDDVET